MIYLLPYFKLFFSFIILYGISFGIIYPKIFSHLGHSKYFDESEVAERLLQNNAKQNIEAFEYFSHLKRKRFSFHVNTNQLSIAIVVPTVKRTAPDIHYVIRVLSRLLQEYFAYKPNVADIIVVNCNKPIDLHYDAFYLSQFIRVVNNTDHLHISDYHEKQCKDMKSVFKYSLEASSADFILVLEDDALPLKGVFKRLDNLINRVLKGYNISQLGLIKLYFPDKWYGYEVDDVFQLLIQSSVFAFFLTCCCYLVARKRLMFAKCIPQPHFVISFLLFSLYFVLFFFAFGRVHLIEILRHYFPTCQRLIQAPRCCIPAVLYTRHFAMALQQEMQCELRYPMDFVLDDTVKRLRLKQFLLFPNMFTHIGFYSSASGKQNDPWEYSFLFPD